ncbi:MAG TPA: hypothetical protein VF520_06485 [Thermoleophilaceae bacterium]|jgi:hypothetical protein
MAETPSRPTGRATASQPRTPRPSARATAAAVALAIAAASQALAPAAADTSELRAARVVAPESDSRYVGKTEEGRTIQLSISARTIQVIGWDFECGRKAIARASVQGIPIKYSAKGYRFKISTGGIVTYLDGEPDENARVAIRGRFSPGARAVTGLLRVKTPRCHDTGYLKWSAKRRSG